MEEQYLEAKYPKDTRSDQIAKLLLHIKEGHSCQLISIPGAGRSTLLGLLAFNKNVRAYHLKEESESFHFVLVNFLEIRTQPVNEALKFLFLQLLNSLEDRPLENAYEKAKALFYESVAHHDEMLLFEGLKKVIDILTLEKKVKVVFLFDRFETYVPMLTQPFFTYIKTLANREKYLFSVVFSLHKPIEYILEPSLFSDIADLIGDNTIYLPLKDTPSLTFRISYIEQAIGKTLPEEIKKELLLLTAGHAKLTRLSLEKLLEQEHLPTNLTEFLLSQLGIQATLAEIWQSLSPAERTHFLKDLFPSVLDDEHSQYLGHVGLMSATASTLPLFTTFTKTQEKEPQQKKLTYVSESKNIFLGDENISESLTATEFRLLSFFLTNPDAVLDRETIIEAVWQENKTIVGVTDQALDQLIFRLRKKVETDPNHPTHLLTVKGRGFRFAP